MQPLSGTSVLTHVAHYRLNTQLFVARDVPTTFAFFADAGNLQRLTPPFLDFRILTPQPIAMHPGVLIDYQIRIHGVPIRWRTEITQWTPPHRFVDQQRRGPYWQWDHTHTFAPVDGGTLVDDTVLYRPIGGALMHALFVRRDIERIFTFRQQEILAVFGVEAREPVAMRIDRV